ncbi:MAG: ThuA domain-containing protein [Chryseolinea sp.]
MLWTPGVIVVVLGLLVTMFMHKVKNGFPVSYETIAPSIEFREGNTAVLLFSKASGFCHGESIEAGNIAFDKLAKKNSWFLYSTDEGGVFNPQQLEKFNAVIFNNSTGRVLNDEQQNFLKEYVR